MSTPQQLDVPKVLKAAFDALDHEREAVDRQIEALRTTAGANEVARESAILTARSQREGSMALMVATERIALHLNAATDIVNQAADRLSKQLEQLATEVHTFTEKADQGTNRLATWTMWLAIATVLLVLAAVGQAWVMWQVAK